MFILFSVLVLALMIFALIDIVTRGDAQVRHLPKLFWIVLVAVVPLVGSIVWFLVGREYGDAGVRIPRVGRPRPSPRPQPSPANPPTDTRSTEQQIADLDREIEEWRLRAEIDRRRREEEEGKGQGA